MNYSEIVKLALDTADRNDSPVVENVDSFLRVVEARVNRVIDSVDQLVRTTLTLENDEAYYALPLDFARIKQIDVYELDNPSIRKQVIQLPRHEVFNAVLNKGELRYQLINNQLRVLPLQDGKVIELVYYRNLLPLGNINKTNWLSETFPDIYIAGLLVEISAFNKNLEVSMGWNSKFSSALSDFIAYSKRKRIGGDTLVMRVKR